MSLTDRDVALYAKQGEKNSLVEGNSNTESLLGPAVAEEGDADFLTTDNYNNNNPNDRLTPVPTATPDPALHAAAGTTMLIKVTIRLTCCFYWCTWTDANRFIDYFF